MAQLGASSPRFVGPRGYGVPGSQVYGLSGSIFDSGRARGVCLGRSPGEGRHLQVLFAGAA